MVFTVRIEALAAHASASNVVTVTRHHPDVSSGDIPVVRCLSRDVRRQVDCQVAFEEERKRAGEGVMDSISASGQEEDSDHKLGHDRAALGAWSREHFGDEKRISSVEVASSTLYVCSKRALQGN